jgi:uncharacterized protein
MKNMLIALACMCPFSLSAQDSTKAKMKAWLGVLTLVEKYKTETNWTKADHAIVVGHFQRLVKYKNEGVLVLAGRMNLPVNDPEMQGLVIFYAKDEAAAKQFMQDDPAVKNNIMLAKVHPYGIAVSRCE